MTLPKPPVGVFADFKVVRTRQVVQVVIEIPLEAGDMALQALGGLPNIAGEQRWFTVVPLNFKTQTHVEPRQIEAPKDRRSWDELTPAQQAGIRCNEERFWEFIEHRLQLQYPNIPIEVSSAEDAANAVRDLCKVSSRKFLTTNGPAAGRWHALDEEYRHFLNPVRAA